MSRKITPAEFVSLDTIAERARALPIVPGLAREARASAALDGETIIPPAALDHAAWADNNRRTAGRVANKAKRRPRFAPPDYIIAIDPGEHAGIAIIRVRTSEVIWSAPVRGDKAAPIARALSVALNLAPPECSQLLIEDQRPVHGNGWKSTRTLHRRAGAWAHEWDRVEGRRAVAWVEPDVWQRAALGVSKRENREERIAAAVEYAGRVVRGAVESPDEAAAVCLGIYGAGVVRGGGRLNG